MDGKRSSDKGHGTCVASVAFGRVGIMIQGTLVAVEVSVLKISEVFTAFAWVIADIVAKGRQGRSVINLSISTLIIQKNDIHMFILIII